MSLRQESLNIAGALIGVLVVGVLAFLAWALVFITVPAENETAMNVLLGILSQQVGIVVGFYFGSSLASKRQTDTIDKQADTIKSATQAVMPPPAIPLAPGDSVTVEASEPKP